MKSNPFESSDSALIVLGSKEMGVLNLSAVLGASRSIVCFCLSNKNVPRLRKRKGSEKSNAHPQT
jgi:hypothetical protein